MRTDKRAIDTSTTTQFVTFSREQLAVQVANLAAQGVFIGTSSWKYPGWFGMLYDHARYESRGKFAQTRFNRDCLTEYAEVFKTVCVDAAYYNFPSQQYLEGMINQTPDGFLFGFKVTDAINSKDWDALRKLAQPGMKAIESIRIGENSERLGHFLRVAKLLRVEKHSKYLDGEPCVIFSFELESEDGKPDVHQLQVAVRDEAGKSTIVDFWNFGW